MIVRFNVPFKNGTINCEVEETASIEDASFAIRLVRSGIAEEIVGNDAIDILRESVGLPLLGQVNE